MLGARTKILVIETSEIRDEAINSWLTGPELLHKWSSSHSVRDTSGAEGDDARDIFPIISFWDLKKEREKLTTMGLLARHCSR